MAGVEATSARFVPFQIFLFMALPVLLQAAMGGFVHGSAVSLWSFASPLLALVVYGPRAAGWWFGVFAAAIVASVALEPTLSEAVEAPPRAMQLTFFALNIGFSMLTVLLVLSYFVRQRDAANARTDDLLGHILPGAVIDRLKGGEAEIADRHEEATVLFADIVGFTAFADSVTPERIVTLLGRAFVELDRLTAAHGLEKIKTLGDGYLAVAGVTRPRADHAEAAAMALEVEPTLVSALDEEWSEIRMRVGLATGPVMAGVIGSERLSFDVWGDTVNTASRMPGLAKPGEVLITEATCAAIQDRYQVERREAVTQYQCVLPEESGPEGARRFLELLTARASASPLCVIKDCGPEGVGLLSFPRPGISIAVDMPVQRDTQELVDTLNEFVQKEGGRVYLSKDAFTRPDHFAAMEPRLPEWQAIRRRYDPDLRLRSAQSVRMLGDPA